MSHSNSPNSIVWAIVAVVVATIFGATAVMLFAPESDVAPLIGIVAPTTAALGALAAVRQVANQVEKVDHQVERVDQQVEDLANGKMDAKIRAGIADVIPDRLLDETYTRHQLAADRMRRHDGGKDDPIT